MSPKSLAKTGFVLLFILQFTNAISSDVKGNELSKFDKANNSQDFNVPKDEEIIVKELKVEDNEAETPIGVTPRENGQNKNKLRGSQEEDAIIDNRVYHSFFEDVISKMKGLTGRNDYCNVSCASGSCGGRCSICNREKRCTDTPDTPVTCGDGCTLSSECPGTCSDCRILNGFRQCTPARNFGQCGDSCRNDGECATGNCNICARDQYTGQLTCQFARNFGQCGDSCRNDGECATGDCNICARDQFSGQLTCQKACGGACNPSNNQCPFNCPCQWNQSVNQFQCGSSISLQCGQACSTFNNQCPANCPCRTNIQGRTFCQP